MNTPFILEKTEMDYSIHEIDNELLNKLKDARYHEGKKKALIN